MMIFDISRPLSPETAAWPGDTPTSRTRVASLSRGDTVNLSRIESSVHNATHADAPLHYDDSGVAIESLDPGLYVGPCLVIDVTGRDPIPGDAFPHSLPARVLLKTGAWPDSGTFPPDFPVLAAGVPMLLAQRGVRVIGVDVPSVDKSDSKTLPVHHALRAANILILESLDLSRIEPGEYELIALPILIPGSDGAFVRAVLRK